MVGICILLFLFPLDAGFVEIIGNYLHAERLVYVVSV